MKKNRLWSRIILSYVALTITIIGLFGGYLISRTYAMLTAELHRESSHQMERIRTFMEDYYLERFEATLLDKAMKSIRASSAEEINYYLNHPREGSYYRIVRMSEDLKTLSGTLEGLDNITLLFNTSGFTVDRHYYYDTIERSPNADLLHNIDHFEPYRWFMRESAGDDETRQLLSYIYTLPYLSKGEHVKGYMMIDVNLSDVADKLESFTHHPEEQFFIFMDNDKLAATNAASLAVPDWKHAEPIAEGSPFAMETAHNNMLTVYSPADSRLGWTYVSERPLDTYKLISRTLKNQIWVASLIVLLLGLAVSYFMSKRFHHTFATMLHTIQHLKGHYDEKQLLDGLHGKASEGAEPSLSFIEAPYVVVLLNTSGSSTEQLAKIMRDPKNGRPHITAQVNSEQLAVVWTVDEARQAGGTDIVQAEIGTWLSSTTGDMRISAGISRVMRDADQLHLAFLEALEAVKYDYIYGIGAVTSYPQIEHKQHISMELLEEQGLESILRSGEERNIQRYFDHTAARLRQADLKLEAIELIVNQIALGTAKVLLELGGSQLHLSSSDVMQSYKKASLEETLEALQAYALNIAAFKEKRTDNLHAHLALSVREYIEQRLEQDISLDDLAAYTSYSKQFICKVFKESYQCTITEFISRKRMDQAKELLMDRSLSIAEVATRCGFRSSPYFCTKFKQLCGVSPAQFRENPIFDRQETVAPS